MIPLTFRFLQADVFDQMLFQKISQVGRVTFRWPYHFPKSRESISLFPMNVNSLIDFVRD